VLFAFARISVFTMALHFNQSQTINLFMERARLYRAEFLKKNKITFVDENLVDNETEEIVNNELTDEDILARAQCLRETDEMIKIIENGGWNPNIVKSDYMLNSLRDIAYVLQHFGAVAINYRAIYLENAGEVIESAKLLFTEKSKE